MKFSDFWAQKLRVDSGLKLFFGQETLGEKKN
jgi:hypothetical protein